MMGLEAYTPTQRTALRMKADKFEEIRDAARDVVKAEKALELLRKDQFNGPEGYVAAQAAAQEVEDLKLVLDRFIQRAAEGDL